MKRRIYIIKCKEIKSYGLIYSVGNCNDRMGYVYQTGFVCDSKDASFRLFEQNVGYVLSENDYTKLGVEISETLYVALCSLIHKNLHQELFQIVDNIYKMNKD